MDRNEMMDMVIEKFGFEAPETINFCWLAEMSDDDLSVEEKFVELMSYTLPDDDDDDDDDFEPYDDYDECGFNPYMGGYDYDC